MFRRSRIIPASSNQPEKSTSQWVILWAGGTLHTPCVTKSYHILKPATLAHVHERAMRAHKSTDLAFYSLCHCHLDLGNNTYINNCTLSRLLHEPIFKSNQQMTNVANAYEKTPAARWDNAKQANNTKQAIPSPYSPSVYHSLDFWRVILKWLGAQNCTWVKFKYVCASDMLYHAYNCREVTYIKVFIHTRAGTFAFCPSGLCMFLYVEASRCTCVWHVYLVSLKLG